jgi:hypothetical protein
VHLVELSVMKQRYQAVMAVVQDGWKVTEVADRLGVSRQAVHKWIARYETGGVPALADRSHRPQARAHQTAPGWGRRILHQLGRQGVDPLPGRSSVYCCLKRHNLIELRRRKKRRDEFRRWERDRPMQLWQMDIMGGVLLDDGTEPEIAVVEASRARSTFEQLGAAADAGAAASLLRSLGAPRRTGPKTRRHSHEARARGASPCRSRALESRDRSTPLDQPKNCRPSRQQPAGQARPKESCRGRRVRGSKPASGGT